MKTTKTIIGLIILSIGMVLDNAIDIAAMVLRQKTINEQLTADYPVNQMNSAIETCGYTISILLYVIGVIMVFPVAYGYLKEKLNKTQNREGEEK